MATVLGGITGPGSVTQNAGTIVTPSSTMFAGSVSINLVQAAPGSSCGASATWGITSSPGTLNVYAAGTNTCPSASGATDWFEQIQWASVTVPATTTTAVTDTFYVTTASSSGTNTATFTVTVPTLAAGGTGTLNLYLDVGPTVTGGVGQSPVAYTGISIAVNQA